MQTVHLKAGVKMPKSVMRAINQHTENDRPIGVFDNVSYNQEQAMIFQGLAEMKKG
ncbi:MAG: hypothetical protein IBX55_22765, partial [Methyloprofundus sp.]|nr:hypothetical protein [Methyloprofundus sp.]